MLLSYVVLLFRIALLPFLVLAVVYCLKHRVERDRRQRHAVLAGMAVASAGIAALLMQTTAALDPDTPLKLSFDVLRILGAGALIWANGYAGILLAEKQGGYWVKPDTRMRPAVLACLAGAGLSFLFSVLFFRALGEPLASGQIPAAPWEWASYLCKTAAHSFGEEVIFRGWCLAYLCGLGRRFRFRPWSANLLIAAIFAVQHDGGIYQMLIAFWAGFILGKIFQRYGLIAAASTHWLLNLWVLVFPYLI